MSNLNPLLLEISSKTLRKKRKLYTAKEWDGIRKRLAEVGKGSTETTDPILRRAGITQMPNGGLHDPEEYGRRMLNGQIKRALDLSHKYRGFKKPVNWGGTESHGLSISWGKEGNITPDGKPNGHCVQSNNPDSIDTISFLPAFKNEKKTRINNNIRAADTLAHEVDEYGLGSKHMKQYNDMYRSNRHDRVLDAGWYNNFKYAKQSATSSHEPGVLRREKKRQDLLDTLYGPNYYFKHKRDREQIQGNKERPFLRRLKRSLKNDRERIEDERRRMVQNTPEFF